VIEVEGLTKVYGGSKGAKALDGVSFTVPKQGIFGFLGPNGAGKTTTIRILSTVLAPTAGTIRIDGHDLREDPLAVKEKLGLMPDEVLFYPTLTGEQHLLYYASFYGIPRAEAKARATKYLDQFGLGDARTKKVKAYSHGMKKRLALAQCLLHDPEVLIMDEPANGLDPQGMRYFRDLIRFLNKEGKTIFLSSHMLAEVEQLCERVGIIDRGRMVAVDAIQTLSARLTSGAPIVLHVAAGGVTDDIVRALAAIPGVEGVDGRRLRGEQGPRPGGSTATRAAGGAAEPRGPVPHAHPGERAVTLPPFLRGAPTIARQEFLGNLKSVRMIIMVSLLSLTVVGGAYGLSAGTGGFSNLPSLVLWTHPSFAPNGSHVAVAWLSDPFGAPLTNRQVEFSEQMDGAALGRVRTDGDGFAR